MNEPAPSVPAIVPARPIESFVIEATSGRKHFSTSLPGVQIAWDSTSLGEFKTCPRSYFYSHILGLRSRQEAIPLTFGIHYHAALELYDRLKFRNMEHDEAVYTVIAYLGKVCRDKNGELWSPEDTKRNTFTLVRAVVWYLENFRDDPLKTLAKANGDPMVELSFRMELDSVRSPEGKPYIICGHMDRIAQFGEAGVFVVDRKTTGSGLSQKFFDNFSPDNQMSLYTLASKVVFKVPAKGTIIDGAELAVGFTRFQRGFVHRSPRQIDEWVEGLGHWLGLAARYAEQQYWPMNDKSCGNYGGCKYRSVCSSDPIVRGKMLENLFEHKPWNPLEER